jgi:PAS domain S-box-containing protein
MAAKKNHTRRAKAREELQPASQPTGGDRQLEAAMPSADATPVENRLGRPRPVVATLGAAAVGPDGDAIVRHLAAIIESSAHAILSKDLDGTIRTWNQGAERLYGYSPDEAVGRSVEMLVPADRAGEWNRVMSKVARGEHVEQLHTERVRKDGQRIAVALTLSPMRDGSGKVASASEIAYDITGRKRTEQELRASEERFRKIFENVATGIAITDWRGRFQQCNPAYSALLGYSEQELHQINFASLVHPQDREANLTDLHHLQAEEVPSFEIENRYVRRDGQSVWVRKFVSVLPDATGKPGHLLALVTDITERKRAEEALRQSEAESRRLLDYHQAVMANMGEGLYTTDTQGLVTYMNPAAENLLGWKSAELLGRRMHDVTHYQHPDGRPFPIEECPGFRVLKGGKALKDHDDVFIRRDGTFFPVVYSSSPLFSDGKVAGLVVVFRDVTDRKRNDERLRQTSAELHARVEELTTLLDILPGGVLLADPQCRRLTGNRAFYEMIGLPQGANASLTSEQSDMPAGIRVYRQGRELSAGEFPMQVTGLSGRRFKDFDHDLVFPDGRVVTLLANTAPLLDECGAVRGVVGAYMDISARKRAEENLRESEARMQAIMNTAADAIITMDIHGMIHSVNPASERMFGYAAAEMVGHNVGLLMPSPYRDEHDGYLKRYLETGEKHIIGGSRELEGRRKDGSTFPIHLVVSEIEDRKLFTGVLRDMTQYKRLEREVVEIASKQQQRISQDLHDSVAQELAALNLMVRDLAETVGTDTAEASNLVERMEQGLQRSQRELRAVLKGLLPVAVDGEGLMTALAELASRTQQQAKVKCTLDCPEPVCLTDHLTATHLYLIAQEAVHNAIKHGRPRNVWIALKSDPGLVLRVQCDGVGMPARPAPPEGLGLRIMRNRAAIIGAHLTIEPAQPTGTVVTCTLAKSYLSKQEKETNLAPSRC